MKSYTDIEQSKKLAEILPIESADMIYIMYHNGEKPQNDDANLSTVYESVDHKWYWVDIIDGSWDMRIGEDIPCWSLAALLDLMPKIHGERPKLDTGRIQTEKYYVEYPYHESTKDDWYSTKLCDSAVDAAFEMVCWLKDNGKI